MHNCDDRVVILKALRQVILSQVDRDAHLDALSYFKQEKFLRELDAHEDGAVQSNSGKAFQLDGLIEHVVCPKDVLALNFELVKLAEVDTRAGRVKT